MKILILLSDICNLQGIKSYRLPRHFVVFLLNHPVARDYLDWVMFTKQAEEHTLQTLARISNITQNSNGDWQVTQNGQPQVQNEKNCDNLDIIFQ